MTVPAPTVIARLNVCCRLTAVATAPCSLTIKPVGSGSPSS
jgi:hypothetical protein